MPVCVLGLGLTLGSPPASANAALNTRPERECRGAFELLSVTYLEAQGPYRVPRQVDEAGNKNGYVCAKALPESQRQKICGPECPVPVLYFFTDDELPTEK